MKIGQPRMFKRTEFLATSVVLAFLFFFLGGFAYIVKNAYKTTTDIAVVRVESASEVVAANLQWVNETSRQLLNRIDNFVGTDLTSVPPEALGFMKDAISTLPGDPRIYLVGTDGQTVLTTDVDFKPIDIRDREYFKTVANGARSYISGMLVSRLNGQQIFVISRRIERNGNFVGAAIISFNSELVQKIWESLQFDPTSTISVVRDDGEIVARFPLLKGPLNIKNSVLFTTHLPKSPEGSYQAVSVADGVRRLVAYRRVDGTNLIAIASMGHTVAFSAFYNSLWLSLAVVIPLALFLIFLAWKTFRWIARDTRQREQLSTALEVNKMLFREIHHRVKNNLQAINSLINLQKIEPEAKKEMAQRVMAMIAVHEQIYRNDQFGLVDASAYIPAIIDKVVESYGRDIELSYDLEVIEVDREQALPLGLIANEVTTNSLKYAHPDNSSGKLEVSFKKDESGQGAVLSIQDDGVGFNESKSSKGMGSKLIVGLAAQLQGQYSYIFENGTRFELRFPIPKSGGNA